MGARSKAVLFDLGGVFIDWNPRHLYRKLFKGDDRAMEEFLATICTPEWHELQDLGKPIREACDELAAQHPDQVRLINAWADRNEEMVAGVIEGSVAVLADLRARGVPCYALSNMEGEAWERRLGRYEFFQWFDGHIISGLVGVAKPDRRIFELAIERLGLYPKETLFVYDRAVNVETAAALGFAVHLFKSPSSLREVLEDLGLLAPMAGRPG